jgi:hypothetical protein
MINLYTYYVFDIKLNNYKIADILYIGIVVHKNNI